MATPTHRVKLASGEIKTYNSSDLIDIPYPSFQFLDSSHVDRCDKSYKSPEVPKSVKKQIKMENDNKNINIIVFFTKKPFDLCSEAYKLTNDVNAAIKMLT